MTTNRAVGAPIELRVLGPLELTATDARDVERLGGRSKRAALLAYLALARPRGLQRRDKLLALFWPELDEPHARAALSQALYVLRSSLGDQAIVTRGDSEVGVDDSVVWCDAVAFEAALDAARPAEALGLYRGDLLDGFFVAGAPEFERWLEGERARLRQRASEGAWAVAEAKAAEGNTLEAQSWARRGADLLPDDEAVARRLIAFLHNLGDRPGAIRAYEAFAWRLTREYDVEPSAETRALGSAIRREEMRAAAAPAAPVAALPAPVEATGTRPIAPAPRPPRSRYAAWAVAVAALAVATWLWLSRPESAPQPVVRAVLGFAGLPPLASGIGGSTVALSPDGAEIVYVGVGARGTQLFRRSMDRVDAAPIPHTDGARLPFFSPDGEWLGFLSGNTIRKVRSNAGPAITVCKVSANVSGASWGSNDVIVFTTPAGLWQVPAAGGEPTIVARADTVRRELYRWPEVLPDGRAVVFTKVNDAGFQLAVLSLQTGRVSSLGAEGTNPHFVTPGYLLFARADGALLAARFDPKALTLRGGTIPVADGVTVGIAGAAKLGVSRTGAFAYVPESAERELVLVDRAGRAVPLGIPPQAFGNARFSPDGRWIATAVSAGGEQPDIWLVDVATKALRRVTFDSGSVAALWSPDGRRIAFGNKPGGRHLGFALHWAGAHAGESSETLLSGMVGQLPNAFSPDGRTLVFQRIDPERRGDIWFLPLSGPRVPTPYLAGPANERAAAVTPDGRWLAYVSDESGRDEVYVRSFPKPGPPVQISAGGGREPRWAPSGRELFYRSEQGLVAASMARASRPAVHSRAVLFDDRPFLSWQDGIAYDVHPDGSRFLMVRRGIEGRELVLVLNWFQQQLPR